MNDDPIPAVDLPPWVERLILVVVRLMLNRYLPHLFNPRDPDGPSDL